MKPLVAPPAPSCSRGLAEQARQLRSRLQHTTALTAQDVRDILELLTRATEALEQCETELRGAEERTYTHQLLLDRRVLNLETALSKLLASPAGWVLRLYRRAGVLFSAPPASAAISREYRRWLAAPRPNPCAAGVQKSSIAGVCPKISIVIDAAATDPQLLGSALSSVEAQTYQNWEVCLALSGRHCLGENSQIEEFPRLTGKVRVLEAAPGATRAQRLRSAVHDASGESIVFLEAMDTLAPSALFDLLDRQQTALDSLVYSDQDFIGEDGQPLLPIFKPDWSPRLARECAYIGGAVLAPRQFCLDALQEEPPAGCEIHSLFERAHGRYRIEHVGGILYHERAAPNWAEAPAILPRSAMARAPRPVPARTAPEGGVDVIICSRTPGLARRCIGTLRATAVPRETVITLVEHVAAGEDGFHLPADRTVRYEGPFDFSEMNNRAARMGDAPFILLINDDVIATHQGWLEALLEPFVDPRVGVAGALLRYPDGAIQHAGIVIGMGDGAGHAGRFAKASNLWPWLTMTREVAAVTGACLAVRRQLWTELNGLDPAFPNNYNDVDFCLRARARGHEVVCVSTRGMIHDECRTRRGVTYLAERERMYARWPAVFGRTDPFYSCSLASTENIALAFE